VTKSSELKEVISKLFRVSVIIHYSFQILQNCSQLKCLKVEFVDFVNAIEFADPFNQPADNIVDLKLTLMSIPSIEGALNIFKRWRYLRRLTLLVERLDNDQVALPPLHAICEFILDLKYLSYLHIFDIGFDEKENIPNLKKNVNDWAKARRPDFVFEIFPTKARSSDDNWPFT
jgi:hypothetical protein